MRIQPGLRGTGKRGEEARKDGTREKRVLGSAVQCQVASATGEDMACLLEPEIVKIPFLFDMHFRRVFWNMRHEAI
jgi:hypothetical protein